MKRLININMGIDSTAKGYLALNAKGVTFMMDHGKESIPDSETYSRVGDIPSVELKRYPLKEGGYAEEFVQAIIKAEDGRRLYFLGLNSGGRTMIWPMSKLRTKISNELCSKG